MNFQDIQNGTLRKLRQDGVNWGNSASSSGNSQVPPYQLKLYINQAYQKFLGLVKDYPIATLTISFATTANQNVISLNPIPVNGATKNPSALQVYEFNYVQASGNQRYIPFVSTEAFRKYTAGYTQILGSYSAFPDVVCQNFGKKILSMFPGTATSGDTVQLTICPDPLATSLSASSSLTAAQGNILSADSDVPLFPQQFAPALIHGAVMLIADDLDKTGLYDKATKQWEAWVQEAIDFGSSVGEGDAEQRVIDPWITTFDASAQVM